MRWTRTERVVACLAVLDGLLGLAVWIATAAANAGSALLLLSVLALLAGAMTWRGLPGGHLAACACYGPRLAAYTAFDLSTSYQVRGALNLGAVIHLPDAVLIVNVFALGMFAASAALFGWRMRSASTTRTNRP